MISSAERIQKSFSKAAGRYEEFAQLQKVVGVQLLDSVENREGPIRILDVGMGTGWMTRMLRWRFPEAKIIGMDFARGMVESAKAKKSDFLVIQADARTLPFKENTFDIVVSNLVYQWIANLPGAFAQIWRSMREGGTFYFTSFASKTLSELHESFDTALNRRDGRENFSAKKLEERQDILDAVRAGGFPSPTIHSHMMKVYFKNVPELLRWLKVIGANGVKQDIFIGKNFLLRTDDFYKRNFRIEDKIFASFEAVWVKAKK